MLMPVEPAGAFAASPPGPSRYAQERRGVEEWPLTLFPEDSGGCPFEVTRRLLPAKTALAIVPTVAATAVPTVLPTVLATVLATVLTT